MQLFFKGKAIAGSLLAKGKLNYQTDPLRLFSYFVTLIVLFCIGSVFLLHNSSIVGAPNQDQTIALAALLVSAGAFFQLVRITRENKALMRKFQASQFKFDQVYNAGIVGMLFTRLDGLVVHANDCFLDMIGYTNDDLNKGVVSWETLTPKAYQAATALAVDQLKSLGYCQPFEKEYIRKDGSTVHVVLASALLNGDDSADAVTYIIDISDKHKARLREEELHQYIVKQKEELQRLLMNAPAMISLRRGPELRLEFSNQASLDYIGDQDQLGLSPKEIASKFNVNTGTEILENVYQTGKPFKAKAYNVQFDRTGSGKIEEAWFDLVIEPLIDQKGQIDGVMSFGFDVTDMVKASIELKES